MNGEPGKLSPVRPIKDDGAGDTEKDSSTDDQLHPGQAASPLGRPSSLPLKLGNSGTELLTNENQDIHQDGDLQRDTIAAKRKHSSLEGPHICPVCDDVLGSSHALTLHIRQHNPTDHSHTCRLCGKTLSSASSLDRHMLVHSGERPFKCTVCHMAFTTNGNMHRHMRTHAGPEESEGPSRRGQKRPPEVDTPPLSPVPEQVSCPVCGKAFLCRAGLASHMATHPHDPIQCTQCCQVTASYAAYLDHRCGPQEVAPQGPGFHDLTFVDFSTGKFSLIAKSLCESQARRPSSAFHTFECNLCKRAFPCSSALRLHAQAHGRGTFCPSCSCDFPSPRFLEAHQLKHRRAEQCGAPACSKEDFLALLELQTRSSSAALEETVPHTKEEHFESYAYFNGSTPRPEKEAGHDFADIQSIISVTSKAPLAATSPGQSGASPRPGSPLEADSASPDSGKPEEGIRDESNAEEEGQPQFACKLCHMSFPSLGLLRKHSQLHSHGSTPYACNVCSYTSMDKSTLIRHLRTHNGERPFQCAICKYAFTTKANCERHVRKRHKKLTKGEVRGAMQYNPHMAERSTNSEALAPEVGSLETVCKYCSVDFKFNRVLRHHLRSLHNSCSRKPFCCNVCKLGFSTKNNCIRHALKQHPDMRDRLAQVVAAKPLALSDSSEDLTTGSIEDSPQKTTLTDVEAPLSQPPAPEEPPPEEPLRDLCLDLSSPNPSEAKTSSEAAEPLNLTLKPVRDGVTGESETNNNDDQVIAAKSLVSLSELPPPQEEPLDLAVHAIDLSWRNSNSPEPLQVTHSTSPCATIPPPPLPPPPPPPLPLTSSQLLQPSSKNQLPPKTPPLGRPPVNGLPSARNPTILESSSASDDVYKMTFKMVNEKLSPKNQRSFSCVYCSAGFTLKSNMERHIKRKHPEYARPTRSRNFIPTMSSPGSSKPFSSTLSDETRTALRVVLSSKANKAVDAAEAVPPATSQEQQTKVESKDDHKAVEDLSSRSVENGSDEGSADLASVSSVIHTANSQVFQQYLLDEKGLPEETQETGTGECSESDGGEHRERKRSSYTDSPNSVACPYCSRKFPWTSSLRRHILTHTGQKPFKCESCPIWFTTKSNCERHYVRKHGRHGDLLTRCVPERPFKCNICPSSTFSTRGNLRKHYYIKHWSRNGTDKNARMPTDGDSEPQNDDSLDAMDDAGEGSSDNCSEGNHERPDRLHCPCCDAAFSTAAEVEHHVGQLIEVPYRCHICDRAFVQRSDCLSHLQSEHTGLQLPANMEHEVVAAHMKNDRLDSNDDYTLHRIACVVCLRRYVSSDGLKRHVLSCHVVDEFACDICHQKLPSKSSVARHKRKHHDLPLSELGDSSEEEGQDLGKPKPNHKHSSKKLLLLGKQKRKADDTAEACNVATKSPHECGNGDLIQNLLGIQDSKIIDEMLMNPADSAARLLGVKQV